MCLFQWSCKVSFTMKVSRFNRKRAPKKNTKSSPVYRVGAIFARRSDIFVTLTANDTQSGDVHCQYHKRLYI